MTFALCLYREALQEQLGVPVYIVAGTKDEAY
jgi:hypothetical protein